MDYCTSCADRARKCEADIYVKGFIYYAGGIANGEPFAGFLCEDHYQMYLAAGSEFAVTRWLIG